MTLVERLLPDGRVAEVVPLTFGRARITVRQAGDYYLEDGW